MQHSDGGAMQQLLHCAAHLELVLVSLPPDAPGSPCQVAHRQLRHLHNDLLLSLAIRDVLLPASKRLSQDAIQHMPDACGDLSPAEKRDWLSTARHGLVFMIMLLH